MSGLVWLLPSLGALFVFAIVYFITRDLPARLRLGLLVLLPLLSLGVYLLVGSPASPDAPQRAWIEQNKRHPFALVAFIENELAKNPADAIGWLQLGAIYFTLNNFYQAKEAYQRAHRLRPNDATILLGLAQTQFFIDDGLVRQETLNWAKLALRKNKDAPKDNLLALYIVAEGLRQEGNKKAARRTLLQAKRLAQKEKEEAMLPALNEALDKLKN